MSGFSRAWAAKVLGHITRKAEAAMPAEGYLAFCTVVPTSSSTGSTITEATGATGYARIKIQEADFNAAAEGETSAIKTALEKVGAAITAGSAVIIGFAYCDKKETGVGNVIMWGTTTSTTISTTQTPPTVAAGGLELQLK